MEIQLQELIEQIKKDGVEAAESKAASIVEAAQNEAKKIIADAEAEAEKMRQQAKEENDRLVRVSEDAIRQAGRNLLISFRDSVSNELEAIVGEQIKNVYSSEAFSDLISKVVAALAENSDTEDISVLLNSKDAEALEAQLLAALKEKLLKGVTVKPNDDFNGGFRIAVNNGKAYYDFSAEEVTNMLSDYLNPRVTALMKEADGV